MRAFISLYARAFASFATAADTDGVKDGDGREEEVSDGANRRCGWTGETDPFDDGCTPVCACVCVCVYARVRDATRSDECAGVYLGVCVRGLLTAGKGGDDGGAGADLL